MNEAAQWWNTVRLLTHSLDSDEEGLVANTTQICAVHNCDSLKDVRGWCRKHYQRWRKTGDPEAVLTVQKPDACTIEGCERPVHGRGLCGAHWNRQHRHGHPLGGGPDRQRSTEICTADGCERPYLALGFCGPHYKAHRLATNPEYRDRKNAAWRKWAAENAEYVRDQKKAWSEANPERRRELMARWRRKHPAASAADGFQRRRRRAALPDDVAEMVDPSVVYARDQGLCHICGNGVDRSVPWPEPMSATMDHIIPVADPASTHSYDNMALAHWNCNQRKGYR